MIAAMLLATGACGVGSDDGPKEEIDENPLGIVCTDAFIVTGTFTASTARPVDVEGCWPAGTWSFTLALDPTDDAILDITGDMLPDRCGRVAGTSAAMVKSSYSFTVTRVDDGDGWVESYMNTTAGLAADCAGTGDCVARLKVSEGGSLECEGGYEIYSADRKMHWNLHPEQETGLTTLQGRGDFTLFADPQVP